MFKLFKIMALSLLVMISACSEENKTAEINKLVIQSDNNTSEYVIELANTNDSLHRGLQGRSSLDENAGMLFDVSIVPSDINVVMWMKDTLIPLDMLFIDENGEIFYIYENAEPNSTKNIVANKRPHAVLEINAGQVKKNNIQLGDKVVHTLFNS